MLIPLLANMQNPADAMAPSSALSGLIPNELKYGQDIAAGIAAVTTLREFTAENQSTFTPANNTVRIPVSSDQFLDLSQAVLEFSLTGTGGASWFDGGAQSIIQRLRVLSSQGVELERIEDYATYASMLDKYTNTVAEMKTVGTQQGAPSRIDDSPYLPVVGPTADTETLANGLTVTTTVAGNEVAMSNSLGGQGYDPQQGAPQNADVARTYSFQLRGAWFNTHLKKLLPPSTAFTVELTLSPAVNCMTVYPLNRDVAGGARAYTVNALKLRVPATRIDDPAFWDRVGQLKMRGYSWSGETCKLYTTTIAPGAGNKTINLHDRSHSLNALVAMMRLQYGLTSSAVFKRSVSTIQYVSDYQYQIGSQLFPPAKIEVATGQEEAWVAYQGNWGGTPQGTRVITPAAANLKIAPAWNESKRAFGFEHGVLTPEDFAQSENNNGTGVLAVNLRAFKEDGRSTSGIDTATQGLPITFNFTTNTNATGAHSGIQVDHFAFCDIEFEMMPGGALQSST
jgi:hypothetical protein